MQSSERVVAFGVLLERGFHHPHTHISTFCIFTFTNQPGHACLLAVMLMNADVSEHRHPPHTHTHCSPRLQTVTKDAVCQKHVPLSQNINRQRAANLCPPLFCFKIQPILHSFWYQPAPNLFCFLFYRRPLSTDFFKFIFWSFHCDPYFWGWNAALSLWDSDNKCSSQRCSYIYYSFPMLSHKVIKQPSWFQIRWR